MESDNASVVSEFISENWEQFVKHCEDLGLREAVAEEIYDDLKKEVKV